MNGTRKIRSAEYGSSPGDWLAMGAGIALLAVTLIYGLYSKSLSEMPDVIAANATPKVEAPAIVAIMPSTFTQ